MGFLDFFGSGIIDSIGKITDELITTDEEKLEKEIELDKIRTHYKIEMAKLSLEEQKLYYGLIETETKNVTERWVTDTAGNFITRSVRPLVLIYMIFVISVMAFMDGNIGEFQINSAYINLFQGLTMTVFIAYFGGKTIERIKGKVRDAE